VTIKRGTMVRSETIHLDLDGVEVEVKGPVRTTRWREELSAFEGVRRRTVSERQGTGRSARHVTRQLVELVHSDEGKTLQLHAAVAEDGIRGLWEQAARTLDLPALDETATGTVVREAEDLDKSIRDLAGEGKVKAEFDTDQPPPPGIEWERDDTALHVTVGFRASTYAATAIRTAVVGLIALFALDNTLVAGLQSVSGIVFVIALAITVEGTLRLLSSAYITRRITVTSKDISCALKTPIGQFRAQSIPIDEVETVRQISIGGRWRIAGYAFGSRDKLVVESDTTSIGIPNLAKSARDWVEGFIVAAVAGAPR